MDAVASDANNPHGLHLPASFGKDMRKPILPATEPIISDRPEDQAMTHPRYSSGSASDPIAFIEARLTDLAEANTLYGKDQQLGAPDKIARNDREISWLKDLRSMIVMRDVAQGSSGCATSPIGQADVEMLTHLADGMGFGRTHDMLRRVIAACPYLTASPTPQIAGVIRAWPEPKVTNPDIADPTGVPYLDCLIHRLLDAQQDINLHANEGMSQSLSDASALLDEVEVALRTAALSQAQAGDVAQPSGDPLAGLVERLDRLCLTSTEDGRRFVLATESASNIVEIVREWIRSGAGYSVPSTDRGCGDPSCKDPDCEYGK